MGKYAIPEKPRAWAPYLEELIFWVRRRDPIMVARHIDQAHHVAIGLRVSGILAEALDRAEALLADGQWLAAEIELDNARFRRDPLLVRDAYDEAPKTGNLI